MPLPEQTVRDMPAPMTHTREGGSADPVCPKLPTIEELSLPPLRKSPELPVGTSNPGSGARREAAPALEIAEHPVALDGCQAHPMIDSLQELPLAPAWQVRPAMRPGREQTPLRFRNSSPRRDRSRVGRNAMDCGHENEYQGDRDADRTGQAGPVSRLSWPCDRPASDKTPDAHKAWGSRGPAFALDKASSKAVPAEA